MPGYRGFVKPIALSLGIAFSVPNMFGFGIGLVSSMEQADRDLELLQQNNQPSYYFLLAGTPGRMVGHVTRESALAAYDMVR